MVVLSRAAPRSVRLRLSLRDSNLQRGSPGRRPLAGRCASPRSYL